MSLQSSEKWQELLVAAQDLGLQVVGVTLEAQNDGGQFGNSCNLKIMASTRLAFAIGRSIGHEMSIGESHSVEI